jgi:hypothetical protein
MQHIALKYGISVGIMLLYQYIYRSNSSNVRNVNVYVFYLQVVSKNVSLIRSFYDIQLGNLLPLCLICYLYLLLRWTVYWPLEETAFYNTQERY